MDKDKIHTTNSDSDLPESPNKPSGTVGKSQTEKDHLIQQDADIFNAFKKQIAEKQNKLDKPKYEFDRLKMLFRYPLKLSDQCTIYQPTIGNIIDYGEKQFFGLLNIFISHTTQYRVQLWHKGIDWNKISDWELFASLCSQLKHEQTQILFGDFDFYNIMSLPLPLTDEQIKENEEHKNDKKFKKHKPKFLLINPQKGLVFTEEMYNLSAEYLRTMFNIFPKNERVKGRSFKEEIIVFEELENSNRKDDNNSSFLSPLISACTNHPGFKYKLDELKDVGICQFMDSVQRLQVYESTVALNRGAYSGFCDLSKVDKNNFNFMRDISHSETL